MLYNVKPSEDYPQVKSNVRKAIGITVHPKVSVTLGVMADMISKEMAKFSHPQIKTKVLLYSIYYSGIIVS